MIGRIVCIAGLTLLAGCSSPEDVAQDTGVARAEAAAGSGTATASATGGGAVAFADNAEQGEAVREFAYAWPAQAAAVPALAERFTAERDAALAEQKSDWDAALKEFAGEDCVACVNRSYDKTWQVVADLPRFLSLSASIYVYTGGAHGNGNFDALVWDREARAAFDPKAMFRSPEALQAALGDAWCAALKVERAERLGPDYADDGFFACPPIADLVVIPGSAGKTAFDRIGLLAAPYVAGSYAEGSYEETLPVTQKVIDAVKPEYRSAFALGK